MRCGAAFTGRVNLFAEAAGLVVFDAPAIDRINAVDESITVATLAPFRPVVTGDMVATVKIIPFATHGAALKAAHRGAWRLKRRFRRAVSAAEGRASSPPCCPGSS